MIHKKKGLDLLFHLSHLWTQSRFLTFPTQCRSVQSAIASRSEKTKLSSENKIKSQCVQLSGVRKRLNYGIQRFDQLSFQPKGFGNLRQCINLYDGITGYCFNWLYLG